MAMLGGRDWVMRGGHANVGGQRMTEAAAEASELASVSGARPGDAVVGVGVGFPVSSVFM